LSKRQPGRGGRIPADRPPCFSNLKAWLQGTHHGRVEPQHLQAYLNEFTFRFNRRFYPFNAFRSLLGIGTNGEGPTYDGLYEGTWKHPTMASHHD
jgi:hypothetical protein